MAGEAKNFQISLKATRDTSRYTAVKLTGDHTFDVCGANEQAVGFLQNEVKANEAGGVLVSGVTFAIASDAISAGAAVATAAEGKVAAAQAGEKVIGYALDEATAAGDIISVLFILSAPTVA